MPDDASSSRRWWAEQYFRYEVTTVPASQKVQRRDIELFIRYSEEEGAGIFAAPGRLVFDFTLNQDSCLSDAGKDDSLRLQQRLDD